MKTTFTNRANRLRNDALHALDRIYVRHSTKSKYGYDALGFSIDNDCSNWCEIIWLDSRWWLVEYRTKNLTTPYEITVDEVCQIVDDILEQQKKGQLQ